MIKYYAFIKVTELKSITKAAEALGYSQPGLSHIIKAFEQELGFPLLIKKKNSFEPTDNGLKILPYCYHLIETEEKLKREAENIETRLVGAIRIGTPNSMLVGFVSYLITYFTKKYEHTDLTITEDTLENIAKKLQEGSVDIAFLTSNISGGMKFYPLFEDRVCLAMHRSTSYADQKEIPVSVLEELPLIGNPPGWDDITRLVTDNITFKPNIKSYSASDFAALAMVRSNLGVYIVSSLQKNLLPHDVVTRPFEERFSRTVGMAVKSAKNLTSIQKAFIRISSEAFSDELKIPPLKDSLL